MTITETAVFSQLTLVQLLRRNAVVIQVVFAVLWSLRFVAAVDEAWGFVVVGGAIALGLRHARKVWLAVDGPRARDAFRSPEGRRFLRPVTRLTLWQIAASVVLPVVATLIGADQWQIPIVATTIGVFLVGFGRPLQIQKVSIIGVAATVASLALPVLMTGEALLATVAIAMVVSLLASAWSCAVAVTAN
ncbi:MAG: hypothetical protein K8R99_01990 [Actinomycetia bacterium]|nr:hypothetical protein [Actinomycetes bacterium]